MAEAGRKRIAASIHSLHGTHRTTRHGEKRDVRTAAPAVKPDDLGEHGAKHWDLCAARYAGVGGLPAEHGPILELTCRIWQEYKDDPQKCPTTRINQLRLCWNELGMTPSAGAKLDQLTADDRDEDDPF